MDKNVKISHGADLDPRHHFATTYATSYGGFALARKPYRPLAASVALTTQASRVSAPTADVKQPTAFSSDVRPFVPYHAKLDASVPSNWMHDHFQSETRKSFQRPSSRPSVAAKMAKPTSASLEYQDIKITDSGFTQTHRQNIKFRHIKEYAFEKETTTTAAYRGLSDRHDHASAEQSTIVQQLVATHPKPGTAFTHNSPTLHQLGYEQRTQAKVETIPQGPKIAYRDIKIEHDGFTRGFGTTSIYTDMTNPSSSSSSAAASSKFSSSPALSSEDSKSLINPMNPMRSQKVYLRTKNAEITGKVNDAGNARGLFNRTQPLPSPQNVASHVSGHVINSGDVEFLSIRGKHVGQGAFVSEQKDRFQAKKIPNRVQFKDVKITLSAFAHSNRFATSPWSA